MNHWENMEPISGTFEATSDFSDWLKELKKSSIVEIDNIGLHDKTTGEKREFVAIDKVLEIINDWKLEGVETITMNGSAYEHHVETLKKMVLALKDGEQE